MNKALLTNNLPKFFIMEVNYIDGSKEEIKCADRILHEDMIEVLTTDNTFTFIFKNNIKSIKFDKSYSKIVEEINKKKQDSDKK